MALTETITWIPVEERLPELTKAGCSNCVLVRYRQNDGTVRVDTGALWSDGLWSADLSPCDPYQVTHWAEMLKGPR